MLTSSPLPRFFAIACLLAVFLLPAVLSPAAVVLSNLGATSSANLHTPNATRYFAQAFKTPGGTSAYAINSVTLNMAAATNSSGNFFVAIYAGEAAPTKVERYIGVLSGTSNPSTAGQYTFTAEENDLVLAPGTTYWIVTGVTGGGGNYRWVRATDSTFQVNTWTADARNANSILTSGAWTIGTGAPGMFSIDATPVSPAISLGKGQQFIQTSAAGPVLTNANLPVTFVTGGIGAPALTLKLPSGATTPLPVSVDDTSRIWPFATTAGLEAAFPPGVYQLSAPGFPTLSMDLGTDAFPVTPQVTNGAWNAGGVLVVNPAQSFTLNFNTFASYGKTPGASNVYVSLEGDSVELGDDALSIPFAGEPGRPDPITSLVIPANTLTSGRVYRVEMAYNSFTTADLTTFPGSYVIGGFTKQLEFFVAAQNTGTTTPPPVIATQPTNQSGNIGGTATISAGVTVGGSGQFSNVLVYWYHHGTVFDSNHGALEIYDDPVKYSVAQNGTQLTIKNLTADDAGTYYARFVNAGGIVTTVPVTLTVNAVTAQPTNQIAAAGQPASLAATPAGTGTLTLQWAKNGAAIPGATNATYTINSLQPVDAGLYTLDVGLTGSTALSRGAIVGLSSTTKLVGPGQEFPDIFHPGTGFTYDQILLQASAATVTADSAQNQILRISYIDLNDDIVQVEFSGPGTLTLVLDNVSGPATPVKYVQSVAYMKGHAGIIITGATENTHLSVFSVGTLVNGNPALYRTDVTYDGFADLAFVAIASANGKFGGLRTANANYFATKGFTGVYAPGVEFTGPVFVGDINASDAATPVFLIGSGSDTRITGGDLLQTNGRAVQVSGVAQLRFAPGTNSHNVAQSAKTNTARLEQNGLDVTAQIVVNPAP